MSGALIEKKAGPEIAGGYADGPAWRESGADRQFGRGQK